MSGEVTGLSKQEAESCFSDPDPNTNGFIMQQTMYRIKDPKRTLKFYNEVLGMSLLAKYDVAPLKFTAYFIGFEDKNEIPKEDSERLKWAFARKATLELVHNWGSENDPAVSYHNGNSDPGRGFGHIGISVPDVYKACEWFEKKGVTFVKKPDGGKMKGIAFIQDPDGYWIEILSPNNEILMK